MTLRGPAPVSVSASQVPSTIRSAMPSKPSSTRVALPLAKRTTPSWSGVTWARRPSTSAFSPLLHAFSSSLAWPTHVVPEMHFAATARAIAPQSGVARIDRSPPYSVVLARLIACQAWLPNARLNSWSPRASAPPALTVAVGRCRIASALRPPIGITMSTLSGVKLMSLSECCTDVGVMYSVLSSVNVDTTVCAIVASSPLTWRSGLPPSLTLSSSVFR